MGELEFIQDNSRFDEPLADSPLPRAKPITGDFDRLQPAADRAQTALLLIDVINDLEFDGGEELLVRALPMAHALTVLKARAKGLGIPVIYVNDNFGRWRSDFNTLVQRCLHPEVRGQPVVALLKPDEDDYFVLKPKHSAFYQTGLEILLQYLGAETLILTGVATDICVLFSANDAYMRDFRVCVPSDCVASESNDRKDQALALMQRVLKADIAASTDVNLEKLVAPEERPYKEPARGNVV
jgi:nicotinamidase-related amidase